MLERCVDQWSCRRSGRVDGIPLIGRDVVGVAQVDKRFLLAVSVEIAEISQLHDVGGRPRGWRRQPDWHFGSPDLVEESPTVGMIQKQPRKDSVEPVVLVRPFRGYGTRTRGVCSS